MIFIALSLAAPAPAQTMTAEQKAPCRADYDRFCRGTMPGGGHIIACLAKQYDKLADPCKRVVSDARQK